MFVSCVKCEIDLQLLKEPEFDPIDLLQHSGGHKRKRVDEDAKKYLTVTAVQAGRSHSGSQIAHVTQTCGESSTRTWEHDWLKEQITASRRSLTVTGVFGETEDASKNGKPAEETILFFFDDRAAMQAAAGVPKVLFSVVLLCLAPGSNQT